MSAPALNNPALASLAPTRRQILEVVKKAGEVTADDLAARLGITIQGIRQHLVSLERDGLMTHREQRDGPGRPRYLYLLTTLGDALFPRNYADLTNELLEYVEAEDPSLLDRIFDKRARRRLARADERTGGLSIRDKVAEVAKILDEDGYLAEFEEREDGSFLITEHNCAVLSVALRYGHACGSELEFLQAALPEAEVTRVAHRIAGGHVCSYVVTPR